MTDVFEASRYYKPETTSSRRGSAAIRSDSRDLLYLLHLAHEKYLRGELTELKYIAAINITLDADAQRLQRAQNPAAWEKHMIGEAQRLGLLDAEGALVADPDDSKR